MRRAEPSPLHRTAALAAVAALFAVVSMPPTSAAAAEKVVSGRDIYFTPKYLVLAVGDEVRWRNDGQSPHTVSSFPDAPEQFDSSPETTDSCAPSGLPPVPKDCMEAGGEYSPAFGAFTIPGRYDYYCKIHGTSALRPDPTKAANQQPCGMCGRIVVKEQTSPSSAPRKTKKPTARPSLSTSPTVSPSPSASASATTEPTLTSTGSPIAAGRPGDGGGGGRVMLALVAIVALSGAGYLTWRKFLGTA